MAKAPTDDERRRKVGEYRETLQCDLTAQEVADRRRTACELMRDEERILEELKAAKSSFKAKLERVRSQRLQAMESAVRGREEREVVVEEWITSHNTVERVRIDTGEVIRTRPASASERNEVIPGVDLTKKPDAKPDGKPKKRGGKEAAAEQSAESTDDDWTH